MAVHSNASTLSLLFFFFQAEDGIRDADVTGVQTCALPILYAALHRVEQIRLGRSNQLIEAWQIRMRRRTACQRVASSLVLVQLRAELGHRRTDGHARCRQCGLQGLAADARVAVAEGG